MEKDERRFGVTDLDRSEYPSVHSYRVRLICESGIERMPRSSSCNT